MATHNSSKLPGYLCFEKRALRVEARAGLQHNYGVASRNNFLYSIAIVVAGLVACWAASMAISALEIIGLSQLLPNLVGAGTPADPVGRLSLRVAGCLGLMVGGYVSAWFASRVQRSEVGHAMLVGCIYGVLGVWSDVGQPMSLGLLCFVFLIAVIAATLGGWLREAQVRRQRSTLVASRLK